MLIAHEAPISILDKISDITDIQYALVHLFESHPDYYNFFVRSLSQGREVILDNSIFELKEAFDPVRFAKHITKLKPTYYVIPDVLEDAHKTIVSAIDFICEYEGLPGIAIGVVQGKTYQEIVECYQFMSDIVDYIAISFDYSYYQTTAHSSSHNDHFAKLERQCYGRVKLVNDLIRDGVWNHRKKHHMLGNSLAKEMKHYKDIPSIRSVDTSNPVVAGLLGHRYIKGEGLNFKPSVLLADLIDSQVNEDQATDITYNTREYKLIANGL
jgi:hypothetical protein